MEQKKKYSILVVDDDENTRWGLIRLLRKEGYHMEEAMDGRHAMEKVSLREYDVVITDMKMPNLGGLDFIRAVKEDYQGRVIIMTAYGTAETYYKSLDYGAFEYINKPIDLGNLLGIIKEIIMRSRISRDASRPPSVHS